MKKVVIFCLIGIFIHNVAFADEGGTLPLMVSKSVNGGVSYNLSIKILFVIALFTLLPALLMTMTAFTRILIVFSILRQALGIPSVPSNQILIGLSFIMTVYVMMPTISHLNEVSVQPYLSGTINEEAAISRAGDSVKGFMLRQTRQADLQLFLNLAHYNGSSQDYPIHILTPAFITSELKTAFQIGFLIFLPFLIIDLVTASVLMSMGMMMLSPMIISLPFKVLFFVLVNGWTLIVSSLVNSFR